MTRKIKSTPPPVKTVADVRDLMAEVVRRYPSDALPIIFKKALGPSDFTVSGIADPDELDDDQIAKARAYLQDVIEGVSPQDNVIPFPDPAAPSAGPEDTDDAEDDPQFVTQNPRAVVMPTLDKLAELEKRPVNGFNDICKRWVWIVGLKRFVRRTDTMQQWDTEQFDSTFNKFVNTASMSKALFKGDRILKLDRPVFRPMEPEFIDNDYNMWRASPIIAKEGDTSLWNAHIKYLIPNESDRNKVLDWMAGILQFQEIKPMHALFLWGRVPGTGKSFLSEVMKRLLGETNCQVLTQDILASGFTGWAMRTKMVVVEEIRNIATKQVKDNLHPWITQKDITAHDKNIRAAKMENVLAFWFMSNKGDYPLDNLDRRYLVIESPAQIHPQGTAHYLPLYDLLDDPDALGAIKYELENRQRAPGYKITGPAPMTDAKADMMVAGRGDLETWLREHRPTCELVTLDDMIDGLPNALRRAGLYNTVREFVKDVCSGVALGEHRLDGRGGTRVSLWAINVDDLSRAKWAARVRQLAALDRRERARLYLKGTDRRTTAEAADDFA